MCLSLSSFKTNIYLSSVKRQTAFSFCSIFSIYDAKKCFEVIDPFEALQSNANKKIMTKLFDGKFVPTGLKPGSSKNVTIFLTALLSPGLMKISQSLKLLGEYKKLVPDEVAIYRHKIKAIEKGNPAETETWAENIVKHLYVCTESKFQNKMAEHRYNKYITFLLKEILVGSNI